jgi:hypothetical protein
MTPAKRTLLDMAVWSAICAAVPLGLTWVWPQGLGRRLALPGLAWLPTPVAAIAPVALLSALVYGLARACNARRETAGYVVALWWVLAVGVASFL